MKILWRKKSYDKAIFDIVKTRYKKNDLISTLVANRGINEDEVESFLKPDINGFYSPFDLPNMDKAVTRIIDAINKKENILIFGDYDVDGMTSTTVLYKYLTERGLNPKNASDAKGDYCNKGYTNIEYYLNDLTVDAFPSGTVTTSPKKNSTSNTNSNTNANSTINYSIN